jgi:hypothetical protein
MTVLKLIVRNVSLLTGFMWVQDRDQWWAFVKAVMNLITGRQIS